MNVLQQYCIYQNLVPGKFVVRRVNIGIGCYGFDLLFSPIIVSTLDEARKHIPSTHTFQTPRMAHDHETILEVWLTEPIGQMMKRNGISPKYALQNK